MSEAEILARAVAAVREEAGDDPRRIDLLLWGTHYLRQESCECCGSRLALQEYTPRPGSLDETVCRWMEIVYDDGGGMFGWVIREHDGARCREVRRLSAPRGTVTP